jgi:hypothetical protein
MCSFGKQTMTTNALKVSRRTTPGTKLRRSVARSVAGRLTRRAAGRAGIAAIPNISTAAAGQSGTPSIRTVSVQPVRTNGPGQRAFPAGDGRSTRIGIRTKTLLSTAEIYARVDEA